MRLFDKEILSQAQDDVGLLSSYLFLVFFIF